MAIHGGWLATLSTPPGSVPVAIAITIALAIKIKELASYS